MARDERELNKTIRKLKGDVRQLRKENKFLQSELDLLQTLWSEDIAEMRKQRRDKLEKKKQPTCPQCGNTTLDISKIGVWVLTRCGACEFFDRQQIEDEE